MTTIKVNLDTLEPVLIDDEYQTVDGIKELQQKVSILFKSAFGDYFEDLTAGLDLDLLTSDRLTREVHLKGALLSLQGVERIVSFVSGFTTSTRTLSIAFTLLTIFGSVVVVLDGRTLTFEGEVVTFGGAPIIV